MRICVCVICLVCVCVFVCVYVCVCVQVYQGVSSERKNTKIAVTRANYPKSDSVFEVCLCVCVYVCVLFFVCVLQRECVSV